MQVPISETGINHTVPERRQQTDKYSGQIAVRHLRRLRVRIEIPEGDSRLFVVG